MQINWSLKKALATTGLALLLTSTAYAIPKGPCDPKPSKDVCCEEPKPGPFAFSFPKDISLSCPRDVYFNADFLAMQPQEDGLEYAITDSTPGSAPINTGTVHGFSSGHNTWDWGFGFRAGVGAFTNHDAWNVEMDWLWFKISEEVSTHVETGSGLIPLWKLTQSGVPAVSNETASSRWHISMNVFDILLGKPFHVSRYMVLNPHFGIRAAWIDQDYIVRYSGSFGGDGSTQLNAKNDFWGVGFRSGMRSEWLMGANLKLLANLSFSSLFGKFDINQHAPGTNGYDYPNEFYRNSMNMEMQAGLAWGTFFNDNRHYFSLQAMYEFHHWFNQNWMRRTQGSSPTYLSDVVSRGDLTMNGVSVRIQLDF